MRNKIRIVLYIILGVGVVFFAMWRTFFGEKAPLWFSLAVLFFAVLVAVYNIILKHRKG